MRVTPSSGKKSRLSKRAPLGCSLAGIFAIDRRTREGYVLRETTPWWRAARGGTVACERGEGGTGGGDSGLRKIRGGKRKGRGSREASEIGSLLSKYEGVKAGVDESEGKPVFTDADPAARKRGGDRPGR